MAIDDGEPIPDKDLPEEESLAGVPHAPDDVKVPAEGDSIPVREKDDA